MGGCIRNDNDTKTAGGNSSRSMLTTGATVCEYYGCLLEGVCICVCGNVHNGTIALTTLGRLFRIATTGIGVAEVVA